jgi:hypothetical protein
MTARPKAILSIKAHAGRTVSRTALGVFLAFLPHTHAAGATPGTITKVVSAALLVFIRLTALGALFHAASLAALTRFTVLVATITFGIAGRSD